MQDGAFDSADASLYRDFVAGPVLAELRAGPKRASFCSLFMSYLTSHTWTAGQFYHSFRTSPIDPSGLDDNVRGHLLSISLVLIGS